MKTLTAIINQKFLGYDIPEGMTLTKSTKKTLSLLKKRGYVHIAFGNDPQENFSTKNQLDKIALCNNLLFIAADEHPCYILASSPELRGIKKNMYIF